MAPKLPKECLFQNFLKNPAAWNQVADCHDTKNRWKAKSIKKKKKYFALALERHVLWCIVWHPVGSDQIRHAWAGSWQSIFPSKSNSTQRPQNLEPCHHHWQLLLLGASSGLWPHWEKLFSVYLIFDQPWPQWRQKPLQAFLRPSSKLLICIFVTASKYLMPVWGKTYKYAIYTPKIKPGSCCPEAVVQAAEGSHPSILILQFTVEINNMFSLGKSTQIREQKNTKEKPIKRAALKEHTQKNNLKEHQGRTVW